MELLNKYIDAFSNKNLKAVEDLLIENVILQDQVVGKIVGRSEVLGVYKNIFSGPDYTVKVHRTLKADNTYILEFSLILQGEDGVLDVICGVDLIDVKEDKIAMIRAYLDTSEFVQE